jgi:hypothetical protein
MLLWLLELEKQKRVSQEQRNKTRVVMQIIE